MIAINKRKQKRFNKGDIVYWCHRRGHEFSVHWGMVYEQFSDAVCIDYLSPKERRLVNGIPIDEFESETRYKKLPKGWSYDTKLFEITYDDSENYSIDITNPTSIKEAYQKGYLVEDYKIFHGVIEAEITDKGYRIVKKYPSGLHHISSVSIRPDRLYTTYEEAKKEVVANVAELIRQSNLTDEEWSIEQIDKTLNRWQRVYGATDELKNQYRDWLLAMGNVEDIETRLYDGNVQWKYWKNKRWNNIEL